jgi:hypothetical protein
VPREMRRSRAATNMQPTCPTETRAGVTLACAPPALAKALMPGTAETFAVDEPVADRFSDLGAMTGRTAALGRVLGLHMLVRRRYQ